jgi:ferric-dicitrate binding protein FerR (iron transport regulator)
VDVADLSVRVLGTRFNLMAYPDENRVLTTLVSGSVEVNTNEGARVVLEPDQQAAVLGGEINVSPVDASYITSWVQGKFNFDNATLEEIAMQISRWYDVKILFAKEELKSLHFSGSMQKFRPLEHLIQRIEATGDVRCRVKGGDIVIDNK